MPEKGLNEMLAAMAVDRRLRGKILNHETRAEAIKGGYMDKKFDISPTELTILESYGKTRNFAEFGSLIHKDLKEGILG